MDEDPFEQVAKDAREQIERLSLFLQNNPSPEANNEVQDVVQDVEETIVDLERSLTVMQRSGQDTAAREAEVESLKAAYGRLQRDKPHSNVVWDEEQEELGSSEPPLQSNYENPFQEQMLREQDVQLDSIHHTMTNLHLQAQTMGEELQDQGELLEDMDANMDTLTGKLSRGRRQLEWIYERNKEKYNDCCIMLLVAALIVLLVLAFIA
ncbi:related to T-SNARE affecting a late Golgi compartment protein 1 [Zygosaccharomyces bailii]|nr:related to T-SNARE affecting a late Golgi compartment protein 1 [Zygosaccharomyces bailii]